MLELHTDIQELMEQNRRTVDGHQFTVPSPNTYPYQWLWDSCFHALILSHFDIESAQAEIRSLLHHQHSDGMLGHITYWDPPEDILNITWGVDHTSSLTQPPLVAYTVWQLLERGASESFAMEVLPKLVQYYDWLWDTRRSARGLLGIINPDESGEDNSPRFDAGLNLPPQHTADSNTHKRYELFTVHERCKFDAHCTKQTFWVEDAPFNAIMVHNLNHLAKLAALCGEQKIAKKAEARAQELRGAMRTFMLKHGRFWSLSGIEGRRIKVPTTGQFIALIADLHTQQEATILIEEYLLDSETFWRPAGIATVAATDPSYDPHEPTWGKDWQRPHWRGPVWMAQNWFIFHGLKRYGYHHQAAELRQKSIALIANQGFREYFHPDTGIGMGAHDFTWGALIIDMPDTSRQATVYETTTHHSITS